MITLSSYPTSYPSFRPYDFRHRRVFIPLSTLASTLALLHHLPAR